MRCGRLAARKSSELDLDRMHSSLLEPGVEISISLVAAVDGIRFGCSSAEGQRRARIVNHLGLVRVCE